MLQQTVPTNQHAAQPLLHAGARLTGARAALILVHGRGSNAQDILSLGAQVAPAADPGSGLALLAPQAAGSTWYPNRFIFPAATNEPWLTWALETVHGLVERVIAAGIPAERVLLLGFSQGACLALEAAARRPARYGGVIGLSGALIENGDRPRTYEGNLAGTPVFLGCSDVDFHIPLERVERSSSLFADMGAQVTTRIYPGMGHTVNAEELQIVRGMIEAVLV